MKVIYTSEIDFLSTKRLVFTLGEIYSYYVLMATTVYEKSRHMQIKKINYWISCNEGYSVRFNQEEFSKYFTTLEKYREIKINEILK